jgi:hypothetical protein
VTPCAGCTNPPQYVKLSWTLFNPLGPFNPPDINCSDANRSEILLEFADPQPSSVYWPHLEGIPDPCIYHYYFEEPTSQGIYGWGVELYNFYEEENPAVEVNARIVVYPLGEFDPDIDTVSEPWMYDGGPPAAGEIQWFFARRTPIDCNNWLAGVAGNGLTYGDFQQPGVGAGLWLTAPNVPVDLNCKLLFGQGGGIQVEPFNP